jgi:hypothetical protein
MLPTDAESISTPQKTQEQPSSAPRRSLRSVLSFADRTFRNVWFYVAAVSLVFNVVYTFRPQLTVSVASAIGNPQASLFSLSNIGSWTLYDVDMRCLVGSERMTNVLILDSRNGATRGGNPLIAELAPGQTATRDCGASPPLPPASKIDLVISYTWLWGLKSASVTKHFDTRLVGRALILVPDVENPSPLSGH